MNVRLHEPGQNVVARGVDHPLVTHVGLGANGYDASIADRDRPLDDLEAVVHGQDCRVTDEDHLGSDVTLWATPRRMAMS